MTPPPAADAAADDDLARAAQGVERAGRAILAGFCVEVLETIDSTNTELMRRARAGRCEPYLLLARHQTAGRGRLGRSWSSQGPEQALTFSFGLPLAPRDWSGLSLAVGLSLAEALHPLVGIKWPNDLWVHERKLAGILIETAAQGPGSSTEGAGAGGHQGATSAPGRQPLRQTVIGVGINIGRPEFSDLRTPGAGMRELWPGCSGAQVLERVALPLLRAVLAFERQGFAPLRERFAARDVLVGRELRLADGGMGVGRGVAEDGALLMHTAAGVQRVSSLEVSVRPAGPA